MRLASILRPFSFLRLSSFLVVLTASMQNFIALHDLEVVKCKFWRKKTQTEKLTQWQGEMYSEIPTVALAKNVWITYILFISYFRYIDWQCYKYPHFIPLLYKIHQNLLFLIHPHRSEKISLWDKKNFWCLITSAIIPSSSSSVNSSSISFKMFYKEWRLIIS